MKSQYIKITILMTIAIALIITGFYLFQNDIYKLQNDEDALTYISKLDSIQDSSKIIIRNSQTYQQNNANLKIYMYEYDKSLRIKLFSYKSGKYEPIGKFTELSTYLSEKQYYNFYQNNKDYIIVCGYDKYGEIDHYKVTSQNEEITIQINTPYILDIHYLNDVNNLSIMAYDYQSQPLYSINSHSNSIID